jgi:hypothetical protein
MDKREPRGICDVSPRSEGPRMTSSNAGVASHAPELGTYPCLVREAECRSEPEWNALVKPYMED